MKQQTASEWLFAHLLPFLDFSDPKEREHFRKCLSEAKAMEKEQIIKSMAIAFNDAFKIQEGKESIYNDWEQYYNETYGGDK